MTMSLEEAEAELARRQAMESGPFGSAERRGLARAHAERHTASGPGGQLIHGLSPGQVEAMYEPLRKRLDAFSPSTSMESLQDTWGPLLPPGSAFVPGAGKNYLASKRGTNRKTANSAMMPSSGSMFSSPAPFLPEFACHRAGTKVLMADGTRTPIEDVRVGDRVIDKDGHIQTVLNT